ncbi:MAG TPA: ABC transporter permease subunit [Negativicutes bacterium]
MIVLHYIKRYQYTIAIVFFTLVAYILATDILGLLDATLFPGIQRIGIAFYVSRRELLQGFLSSLGLLLPSYLLALLFGITLGLVVGWYQPLRRNLVPLFRGLSSVPPTLFIPYAIALLPTFWSSSVFIIFIGAFWPIFMGTIHGVVLVEDRYLDNARTLGLHGFRLLRKVIFPAALPMIFSGAGMAMVFTFIMLTVAEMFGVKSGMGFFIQHHADFFDYAKVLAGMIFMATFIVIVMAIFDMIQNRMLHWVIKR